MGGVDLINGISPATAAVERAARYSFAAQVGGLVGFAVPAGRWGSLRGSDHLADGVMICTTPHRPASVTVCHAAHRSAHCNVRFSGPQGVEDELESMPRDHGDVWRLRRRSPNQSRIRPTTLGLGTICMDSIAAQRISRDPCLAISPR
jgi:hypothetical protein